jgi:uncharacterized protein (TIGR01244 family)
MMGSERFRRLDEQVYVAPQLEAADFEAARAAGVRTIINNRPDGEAPDQLPSAEAAQLAEAAGLDYVHIPVPSGGMTRSHVDAFTDALAGRQGPFLAYCRSGTRCCHLWAFTAARQTPVDIVVESAARAGYDLEGARPVLEQVASEAGQPTAGQR